MDIPTAIILSDALPFQSSYMLRNQSCNPAAKDVSPPKACPTTPQLSDVSLATSYGFDKENAGTSKVSEKLAYDCALVCYPKAPLHARVMAHTSPSPKISWPQ
jgi:hypothetical protein